MGIICFDCDTGIIDVINFLDGTQLWFCNKCNHREFKSQPYGDKHTKTKEKEGCEKVFDDESILCRKCFFCKEKDCQNASKIINNAIYTKSKQGIWHKHNHKSWHNINQKHKVKDKEFYSLEEYKSVEVIE